MRISCIGIILISLLTLISCAQSKSGDLPLSPASEMSIDESGWEIGVPEHKDNYFYNSNNLSGVLKISSDSLVNERWFKKIDIDPYARYRITGRVKTINVKGEEPTSGAGMRLERIPFVGDTTFKGDNDWTPIEAEFDSEDQDSFILELLLGKKGLAKGTVLYDDFRLQKISQRELNPTISLSVESNKEVLSPLIYGQFIEMMGRSFYGGVWAEMLVDRKFFYTPGTKRSAWYTNVDTTTIERDKSHTFSKGDIPIFSSDADNTIALSQSDLAVEKDSVYEGRIVLKSSGEISGVQISLSRGNSKSRKSFDLPQEEGYSTVNFDFIAKESSENAKLQISFEGKGAVTIAAASLMPQNNIKGFRPDVLRLMKQLNAPIYRWPGGNFVSGYDWRDGIGDPDKRPTRFDEAWKALEYNDVGIDEFMQLCDLLGTKANIAVNTGLGTAKMAAEEVEYINGNSSTPMGSLRAKNGHESSYGVGLWAVGNEMFGDWQLGNMPVKEYVEKHNRVAEAMREVDPDIELIGVGELGKWNTYMYKYSSDHMDYISEHFYRQDWHAGGLMTHVGQIPSAIRDIAKEHYRLQKEHPERKRIKVAVDEWNYWYGPHIYGQLGTRYFLRDALGIAAGINEFSRHTDLFHMANYAQTVNVIGAIKTTKTNSFMSATGLVLQLYRENFSGQPLSFTGDSKPLDVAATIRDDGNIALSVINATHQSYPLKIAIKEGEVLSVDKAFRIIGDGDMSYNDENHPDHVRVVEDDVEVQDGKLSIPKESATIFVLNARSQ